MVQGGKRSDPCGPSWKVVMQLGLKWPAVQDSDENFETKAAIGHFSQGRPPDLLVKTTSLLYTHQLPLGCLTISTLNRQPRYKGLVAFLDACSFKVS
jgi:hypothetical protein